MSLKDNWNREPLVPHSTIRNIMVGVWGVVAVWMLICGFGILLSLATPAVGCVLAYLLARLIP
jgi:hypothetical protein